MATYKWALLSHPRLADAGSTELVSLDPPHLERHVVGVVGGCGRDREVPGLCHRHVIDRFGTAPQVERRAARDVDTSDLDEGVDDAHPSAGAHESGGHACLLHAR